MHRGPLEDGSHEQSVQRLVALHRLPWIDIKLPAAGIAKEDQAPFRGECAKRSLQSGADWVDDQIDARPVGQSACFLHDVLLKAVDDKGGPVRSDGLAFHLHWRRR